MDDNDFNSVTLQEVINQTYHLSSEVASNGLEALNMVKERPFGNPYKLILMDCMMPIMDGFTATRAIR